MRWVMWLALSYLAVNYFMYPSIAKGISVGLLFTYMTITHGGNQ